MLTMPALHTAGGQPPHRTPASRWLPLMVGLAAAAVTLGLWRALLAQERAQITQTTALQLESVRNEISVRMESRLLALRRMARRWELRGQPPRAEWESDAALYVYHYAGYRGIGWLDDAARVRWAVPAPAGKILRELDPSAGAWRESLLQARTRRDPTLTAATETGRGEMLFQVNVPIFHNDRFGGHIVGVLHAPPLLDAILRPHIASGYGIEVYEGQRLLFQRGASARDGPETSRQESNVDIYGGLVWRVRVWPQPEILAATRSPLPQAVLAGGLAQALLLAIAVHLAQLARFRAREVESVNRELRAEIGERRQAQERLRKLSCAVEQSPTMVMITDTGGAIEYVNPKFTQITGYTLDELRGQNPRLLKSGTTDLEEYQRLWETIANGGEWRGELQDRKKNGELFWVHTAISSIRDAQGVITHYLAEMEDVTRRKRLEQEVAERNREITKTQALTAMGQAASMIAHDLRNPLSSVKMALQILGKRTAHRGDGEASELKQIALDQVRYMDEILADLLQYSLPDALKPAWLSMDKLLDITISSNEKFIKEHGARVITDYQSHLPSVHADATKLREAFSNLIMNALQATENTGREPEIRICARLEPDEPAPRLRVELHDNGLGIDPAQADKLFEPFYTTRAKGTGLGLAIVKRIIDQHHGRVTLTRDHDGGTCATVVLPTGPVNDKPRS